MACVYAVDMATHRTTILLDEETRRAARELALRYGCSVSEAIRRAVVDQRDSTLGVPAESRTERRRVLERLFELFEGNDPAQEVAKLKEQDETF